MTKRFETAFNALTAAFFDGTLAKGNCSACAVGNIVAASMGGKVYKLEDPDSGGIVFEANCTNDFWANLFHTTDFGTQYKNKDLWGVPISSFQIIAFTKHLQTLTLYKVDELAKVEHAFETNTAINWYEYKLHTEQAILEDQYSGLMAVMNVLIELDQVQDGEIYKTAFKKHPKLQTV